MLVALYKFQLDISGIDFKDLQPINKEVISVTLFRFHLEISGKDSNDLQSLNKLLYLLHYLNSI